MLLLFIIKSTVWIHVAYINGIQNGGKKLWARDKSAAGPVLTVVSLAFNCPAYSLLIQHPDPESLLAPGLAAEGSRRTQLNSLDSSTVKRSGGTI